MLFARFEGFGTNDWLPPAFLANATLEYKYTRGLYTSLGLIAGVQDGGEPAEIGEGVFHVFVMIMSLLIFAYAIGAVASIEESINESALKFQTLASPVNRRVRPVRCAQI